MLAREEALLDEMLCGRRRATEDDPLRHAHREHPAGSDEVRACSWLMIHSSFSVTSRPERRGTGLRTEYATLGGGETVSCRVFQSSA